MARVQESRPHPSNMRTVPIPPPRMRVPPRERRVRELHPTAQGMHVPPAKTGASPVGSVEIGRTLVFLTLTALEPNVHPLTLHINPIVVVVVHRTSIPPHHFL